VLKVWQNFKAKLDYTQSFWSTPNHQMKDYLLYEKYPFSFCSISDYLGNKPRFNLNSGTLFMEHETSAKRAKSIIFSQMIFGRDMNQAAHFELLHKRGNAVAQTGVTMIFEWRGMQKSVPAVHDEGIPNILFHVCASWEDKVGDEGQGHWESRLYPGTNKGLFLHGVYCHNTESFICFENPISISVVSEKKFQEEGYCFFDD
jgi:hypothetical protein